MELREATLDVCCDVFPALDVEERVALGYLSHNQPRIELTDVLALLVRVHWLSRHHLKANGTHVVVVAVVDVSLILTPQPCLQIIQGLVPVDVLSLALAVHLPSYASIALLPKLLVQQAEPTYQSIVACE